VKFVNLPGISVVDASLPSQVLSGFVGSTITVGEAVSTFSVNGQNQKVKHFGGYFDLTSSNETVAISGPGALRLVGEGSAQVTATLAGFAVAGSVTLGASSRPTEPAHTPTHAASDVVSLFSDAYTDHDVADWNTEWGDAVLTDSDIQGNAVKAYTNLSFAGIDWATSPANTINANDMTHFHMDVYSGAATAFSIKLVDFGPDGVFGFAPDSERDLTFDANSIPAFTPGEWVCLDIPLQDFMGGPNGLFQREHMAQLIIGTASLAVIDNVYFHK
jgi:hypothetical protein